MKKTKAISMLGLIVTAIMVMAEGFALAETETTEGVLEVKSSVPGVSFWIKNSLLDPRRLTSALDEKLPTFIKHPLLAGRLPARFGVIIDGAWTGATGFTSPELKAPDGAPAILLKPSATLESFNGSIVMAHELIHLAHYRLRAEEDSWVREGVALLGEYLVTGSFNSVLALGFSDPETSLTAIVKPDDPDSRRERAAQYGHVLQFFYYLYRVCGGNELYSGLLTSQDKEQGISFIDGLLKKSGSQARSCQGFSQAFHAFELARFSPDFLSKDGYIMFTAFRTPLRQTPPSDPLPSYSAAGYVKGADGSCSPGDFAGSTACVRIIER
jgi:hypothetical protein